MSHDGDDENFFYEYYGNHQEIFADLPLARRERSKIREDGIHRCVIRIIEVELVDPNDQSERKEREAEADPRPVKGAGGWCVSNRGLKGPVLRPGRRSPRPARDRRKR